MNQKFIFIIILVFLFYFNSFYKLQFYNDYFTKNNKNEHIKPNFEFIVNSKLNNVVLELTKFNNFNKKSVQECIDSINNFYKLIHNYKKETSFSHQLLENAYYERTNFLNLITSLNLSSTLDTKNDIKQFKYILNKIKNITLDELSILSNNHNNYVSQSIDSTQNFNYLNDIQPKDNSFEKHFNIY